MASFDYTIDLERALLNELLKPMLAKLYMHRVRDCFFTSPERRFIFDLMTETFNTSRAVVTRTLVEYGISSKIDDKERTYFIGEWNIIEAANAHEDAEVLIQRLETAHIGRELSRLGDEVDTLLERGDIEEALSVMKHKAVVIGGGMGRENRPISELSDITRRKQTLIDKKKNPEKYRGLKTGFEMFDNTTGGLFPGELTLVAGITGTGKSTIVRQIQRSVVMLNPGKNVLHIANEEYLEQVEHKFDANFTDIPYLDFKRGEISDKDLEAWEKYMKDWKHGRVFIKEVPAFTDVTLIEQPFRELEARGIKIDLITIDHLPNVKPIQKYFDTNDERAKAAADCKEIARWLRVPVLVPTQAATEVEKKQKRGQRGDKMDVYGSKAQVHVANTFILITVRGVDDNQTERAEWERDVFWLCDVKKNRDGPPFWFEAKHLVRTGRVEEIKGKGDKGAPKEDKLTNILAKKNSQKGNVMVKSAESTESAQPTEQKEDVLVKEVESAILDEKAPDPVPTPAPAKSGSVKKGKLFSMLS